MRFSLFYALQGVLSVAAYEKLAYNKDQNVHRGSDCDVLDGCGKSGKDNYVPDPKTFFFPDDNYRQGDSWDLIKADYYSKDGKAFSEVFFDFKDDSLVFKFPEIHDYEYEDVEIIIQREEPPNKNSPKYNLHSHYCQAEKDSKEVRCQVPYFALTNGGSYEEMCPLHGEGSWVFYIEIKVIIKDCYGRNQKKYELYSRAVSNKECWFSLSYCCSPCPDCKPEPKPEPKPDCPDDKCKKPEPKPEPKPDCPDNKCKKPEPKPEPKPDCPDNKCKKPEPKPEPKPDCPEDKCDRHPHKPYHGYNGENNHDKRGEDESEVSSETGIKFKQWDGEDEKIKNGKFDYKNLKDNDDDDDEDDDDDNKKDNKKDNKDDDKDDENDKKSKKNKSIKDDDDDEEDDDDVSCGGAVLVAWGEDNNGKKSRPLSDLKDKNKNCDGRKGKYLKYSKQDLEVEVEGNITIDGEVYGEYFIGFEKDGNDAEIAVGVKVDSDEFTATGIAVYVECEGGYDAECDICRADTYQYFAAESEGLDNYKFLIADEFKCYGDYIFVIAVEICAEDDNGKKCNPCKGQLRQH